MYIVYLEIHLVRIFIIFGIFWLLTVVCYRVLHVVGLKY